MDFKLENVLVSLHSLKTMGLGPFGTSAPLLLRNGELLGHSPILKRYPGLPTFNYRYITAGNRHKQNSWFCKEIREDNFGFGGGEFTKTLRKVCTCQNWNFLFYCSNIAKSENPMLLRMLSRLETCIVYSCIWGVTLAKSIVPRKTWRKLWHSYISKLFLTKMQVIFSIFFHHGSLNVIGDKFRFRQK